MENLDKLDLAILQELQCDGRVTVTELASRVGLSKTPCQIRMKRLEEQGYILGYIALIDQKKIGSRHVASTHKMDAQTAVESAGAQHKAYICD